ncbi:unnamed protein product [Oikopleura dioica]|uniref:Coiled-coil domain-containing protein 6 n=1 Tax=Oikopleura dioica TaxID=34765 RepID=E4WRF7_OIKDI|nr:unnamed protein product [Oikopleura dioica]
MDPALGAASPMSGGNSQSSGLAALPKRDEIPSSRSSMADSASEMSESDTDAMSLSGISGFSDYNRGSTRQRTIIEEQATRINTMSQENRVMKIEIDKYKIQVGTLQEEIRRLRQASVNIQARAEQEEEYISNTLLKKIEELKKEKETLANYYEKEEEFLTNQLSKKLNHLRHEKCNLERTLEREQEYQVNKLMKRIERMEREAQTKHTSLDQLRREKVELENTLEREQEALVNRLWKKLERLETEKKHLQTKINEKDIAPRPVVKNDNAEKVEAHVKHLKREVDRLRKQLFQSTHESSAQMRSMETEERQLREKNMHLQRKLQQEIERREALSRHLSESESSLELETDERYFQNDLAFNRGRHSPGPYSSIHPATVSSVSSSSSGFAQASSSAFTTPVSPYRSNNQQNNAIPQRSSRSVTTPDRFVKPSPPPSPGQQRLKDY